MNTRNHSRAAGQSKISLSLPTALLAEIDSLAAETDRNRSNTIVHLIRQQIKASKSGGVARRSTPRLDWDHVTPATPEEAFASIARREPLTPEVMKALSLAREEGLRAEPLNAKEGNSRTSAGEKEVAA
ncbi:MAG: hypothetical protein RL077_330 [Verrucomicrobiota bacterium]|jgi:hypothetical protein